MRTVEAARQLAQLEPDAIGLNFYAPSSRCVDEETAAAIVKELPECVEPIGLFVNHALEEVLQTAQRLDLRTVQLHGDESPEFVAEVQRAGMRVIRAFRVGEEGLGGVAETLAQYAELGIELRACLVDARVHGAYGGTGKTAPWELLANGWQPDWPPLVLAGGLTPANVCDSIQAVHPWGVDTASGVEAESGQQDEILMQQFVDVSRRCSN
ncbi:MAG: phosphoribosylanthranilate isomerase [Planctomycetaceae bacterium]|nr:phosphoribosylanthranilate isomerase [Planctomycetaceae bacterium]